LSLAEIARVLWRRRDNRPLAHEFLAAGSRLWIAILVPLAALTGVLLVSAQTKAPSEYELKAAFLYHFAQFVEWPPQALDDAGSPLVYCTLGDDPFQGGLDTALMGKTLGTHPLQVRHLKHSLEAHGCQVVFIGGQEKKLLASTLAALKDDSVLVVGESEHFAQDGGTIGFCLEGNKIRFDINLTSAAKAKLKVSSKLLALAKNVIGGPKGT